MKTYIKPELTTHGLVNELTTQSNDSSRKDTFFGPPNASTIISEGLGSLDACIIPPGGDQCL